MELLNLVENLERRLSELVSENQSLRETAQLAEVYQDENRVLTESLAQEREARQQTETRISAMLSTLDEHLTDKSGSL